MTPEAYAAAISRLDRGTLPESGIAKLHAVADARLRAAGLRPVFAQALLIFWGNINERRQAAAQAEAIAKAATRLRLALERSPLWRDHVAVPDAMLW